MTGMDEISPAQKALNRAINEGIARSAELQLQRSMQANTAELRSQMAKAARDFCIAKTDVLKRSIQRNRRQVGSEIVWLKPEEVAEVEEALAVSLNVQNLMSLRVGEWAEGVETLEAWSFVIPTLYDVLEVEVLTGVRAYRNDGPEVAPMPVSPHGPRPKLDNGPEVISPPIPMPTLEEAIEGVEDVSPLELPDQGPNLNEILAKAAEDNSKN